MRAEYDLRSYYEYLEKEWEAHNERTPFPREQSARALRPNP